MSKPGNLVDLVAREGYLLDLDQGLDLTDAGEADQAARHTPGAPRHDR